MRILVGELAGNTDCLSRAGPSTFKEIMGQLSAYQQKAVLGLLEDGLKEDARKDLLSFTCYTKDNYNVNWHHKVMCQHLNDFAEGRITRLMVFMPPRHGKSELVSRRLPAYLLGRNPDLQIITASYSDSLAAQMNRDVQRIIETPEYAYLFPETKFGEFRNSGFFEIHGRKGRYKSAGIGTGITGMGADVAIIDDPVKDSTEADFVKYRDRAWDWYNSVLSTRLEKNARVLLTMTRWHEDDLAGRLIELAAADKDADQWVIVNYPAVKDDPNDLLDPREIDEALWPWKYDEASLRNTKASKGTRVWNSLYQQRPTALEGGMIKRTWMNNSYMQAPDIFDQVIQSWDLTFKKSTVSDYVVGQVWGKIGADIYLLDQVRNRLDFPETVEAIRRLSAKWPQANVKIIEDKANGPAVMSTLKKELVGIVPFSPDTSKEARLSAVSVLFEAGNIWLPNVKIAPWIKDYINELCTFPNGVNDDQCDGTSQALLRFMSSAGKWTDKMKAKHETIAGSLTSGDQW